MKASFQLKSTKNTLKKAKGTSPDIRSDCNEENVNTEMLLLKAKNEKVTKSFGYLRQSYIRLKDDVAYYKKGKNPPRRGRSQSNTPL